MRKHRSDRSEFTCLIQRCDSEALTCQFASCLRMPYERSPKNGAKVLQADCG
ncbi:hypothetical protein H6H02_13525 [Coleofasciculus sp. FACHB-1120]|nr:hypothetical protein [Coleofasciculus sp. FACHB-1120]